MNNLKSFFAENQAELVIFLCVLAVYGLSYYKRQASYDYWMKHSGEYVVEQVTAMSTMDAYWWLKGARDMDEGRTGKGLSDPLKLYPDQENYVEEPSLLVRFIGLAKFFTTGDYYKAGLLLVPILAGLFVFPLFTYFQTLGFGASAVLGGLIGSFSWAYYSRSAMGFVDTDLLNLFFPIAVSALVVKINRDRMLRSNLLLGTGAGLIMHLFVWWYQQSSFILVYLFFIAVYLILSRFPWKQTALILLIFAAASGPYFIWQSIDSLQIFLNAYFFPKPTGQIVWPDIMKTIQESRTLDLSTKFKDLFDFLPVVFAGFSGLLWLYVIRFKQMVPITPLVLIGIWSLFGPSRFTMYLSPFIGVGAGVLIELVIKKAGKKFKLKPFATSSIAVATMLAVFFPTISDSAYNFIPGPAVPAPMVRAILEIKRTVPKHSAMLSWWAEGYPLMEIGEFATYHDNGSHGGIRSTLIAKALTSQNQKDMAALPSCLENYTFERLLERSLEKNLTGEQLVSMVFSHPITINADDVFVLYTHGMIESFEAISISGTWDFQRKTSEPMRYTTLTYFSQENHIINYHGGRIDLNRGIVTDGTTAVPLLAALFINNGYVVDRIDFDAKEGVYLQVLIKPNQLPELQLVEEPAYLSNFNQQFILGNYDRLYFEEVYNNYPVARVLKVKSSGDGQILD